jgi:GntR family transcriptional regulator
MQVTQCRKEVIMNYIFDNERPIYIQLVEIIRIEIVSGKFKKGQRMPSVRELALIMKVNPNTMQKALAELENEQLIYTERTNGKYVTEDEELIEKIKRKLAKEIIDNYLNNMKKIGIDYDSAVKYLQEGGKDGIS